MLHELCLLLGRLHRHGANRRPSDGLAARRSINRTVLVVLDVGLDVFGRRQPYAVAELLQFACPVMGRCTGFHADEARRELGEKGQYLRPPQRLVEDHVVIEGGVKPTLELVVRQHNVSVRQHNMSVRQNNVSGGAVVA